MCLTLKWFGTSALPFPESSPPSPVHIQEPNESIPSVLTPEIQAPAEHDLGQVFHGKAREIPEPQSCVEAGRSP